MGWLDSVRDRRIKDKVPERLRNKEPEEIAKELEEAEALKKKVEEAEAARKGDSEAVTAIKTELEKVKAQLALAEASRNTPPKEQPKPEEVIDFTLDPEGALRQRMRPVAEATVLNSAMTARILAQQQLNNADSINKTMDGRLFQAWGDDIDAESRKYQAIQLANPQAWIGIFYYLKGIRSEELANPEVRKKKYSWLEPAASSIPPEEPKSKKDELTPEEKRVAAKMGVTEENYLKRKKAMTFVAG